MRTKPDPLAQSPEGLNRCLQTAIFRLQMRMQSAGELGAALKEKGYAPDDIQAVLEVLTQRRYLNDDLYAEALLRRYRKKSRPAVIAALRAHRLDKDTIDRAMENWEPDTDSLSLLLSQALRREDPDWEPCSAVDAVTARKAALRLYRRGFSRQQVDDAFEHLRTARETDEEYEVDL